MGKASTRDLPNPILTDQKLPLYYAEVNGEQRLHPAWQLDWAVNEVGWGADVARIIQRDGAKYYRGELDPEQVAIAIAAVDFDEIVDSVHGYFKTCQSTWKSRSKEMKKQKDDKRGRMLYARQKAVSDTSSSVRSTITHRLS